MPSARSQLPTEPVKGTNWASAALFAFGTIFFTGLLVIAFLDRDPPQTSWYIYDSVLAMAAGGIAALLPGSLSLKWNSSVTAGGAFAIAVVVFYGGKNIESLRPKVQDLKSFLLFPPNAAGANPNTADVYVVVNEKVVKSDVISSKPELSVDDPQRGRDVSIVRGPAGVRIDFKTLLQGDKIFVAEHSQTQWWKSSDMTIPEAELEMGEVPLEAISKRVNSR